MFISIFRRFCDLRKGHFLSNRIHRRPTDMSTIFLPTFRTCSTSSRSSKYYQGHQGNIWQGMLIAVGNPLLDISAVVEETLLKKYNLKSNDAILAEEKHMSLYQELKDKAEVEFIAGGSAQNSVRVAQWILQKPHTCVFLGCVGEDDNSKILEKKASQDGVKVIYQYTNKRPTGRCAVLITDNGAHRSLVANLAAAECFTKDHLEIKEVKNVISNAEYYYSSGFFITVSTDTILELAQLAHQRSKYFLMNLSAAFIPTIFNKQVMQVFPYVDILFGNDEEAKAFATVNDFGTDDIKEIGLKMVKLPKQNEGRQRLVILTQGVSPVLFFEGNKVTEFPVKEIPKSQIVDTNGAGDAFVGGFIAQLLKGENYDVCIKCGIWAASRIVQTSGTKLSGTPDFEP